MTQQPNRIRDLGQAGETFAFHLRASLEAQDQQDYEDLLRSAVDLWDDYKDGFVTMSVEVLLAKVIITYDAWVLAGSPGSDPDGKCDLCGSSGLTHDPKCPAGNQTSFF